MSLFFVSRKIESKPKYIQIGRVVDKQKHEVQQKCRIEIYVTEGFKSKVVYFMEVIVLKLLVLLHLKQKNASNLFLLTTLKPLTSKQNQNCRPSANTTW